ASQEPFDPRAGDVSHGGLAERGEEMDPELDFVDPACGDLGLVYLLPAGSVLPDGYVRPQLRVEALPSLPDGLGQEVVGRLACPKELPPTLAADVLVLAPPADLPSLPIPGDMHELSPPFPAPRRRLLRDNLRSRRPRLFAVIP